MAIFGEPFPSPTEDPFGALFQASWDPFPGPYGAHFRAPVEPLPRPPGAFLGSAIP
jgi:hypothetical protein